MAQGPAGRKTAGGAPHLGVGALHGRARRAAPGALLGAAGAAAEEPLAGAASGNWYWTESVHKLFINSGAPPLWSSPPIHKLGVFRPGSTLL